MLQDNSIPEVAIVRALGFERTQVAVMLFGEAGIIGLIGGGLGAGLALALFGHGITMGAVVGGLAYMQVTPDLAFAAMFTIFVVSLAAAIVRVIQAVNISPAIAFRKVV